MVLKHVGMLELGMKRFERSRGRFQHFLLEKMAGSVYYGTPRMIIFMVLNLFLD